PEQAAAEPHVDDRADIYSVGAVAYELLTGRPPFVGMGPQQVLSAHITLAPDPVARHRENVPPALAQLVMRCLEKRPADRWQGAEELLAQIGVLATPSGGMTPTETAPARVPPPWPRIAAVVLLAVALAAVLMWWVTRTPAPYVVGNTTQVTNATGLGLDAGESACGQLGASDAGRLRMLRFFRQ